MRRFNSRELSLSDLCEREASNGRGSPVFSVQGAVPSPAELLNHCYHEPVLPPGAELVDGDDVASATQPLPVVPTAAQVVAAEEDLHGAVFLEQGREPG